MMKKLKYIIACLTVLPLAAVLAACGGSTSDSSSSQDGDKSETVKIAVVGPDDGERAVFKQVAEEKGYSIEYVELGEYSQANPALKDGEVEMNWFQHIAYLADYNVSSGDNIVLNQTTAIFPLGLYSKKYDNIKDIPQGGEVVIPDDSINEARAINVLKSAGLVKLKDNNNLIPKRTDIDEKKSKVKVTPVEAAQTVIQGDSVDGYVVNQNFLDKANIDPKSALAQDDPKNPKFKPYANGFAVRNEDKDNQQYKDIAKLYHDKRVTDKQQEISKNTAVEVDYSQKEIDKATKDYEEELRKAKQ